MPFLFGVPSTFFIVNKMEVPEDVVFVNIDTGKVNTRIYFIMQFLRHDDKYSNKETYLPFF